MLQNARIITFTISELLRKNQQVEGGWGGDVKFVAIFAKYVLIKKNG